MGDSYTGAVRVGVQIDAEHARFTRAACAMLEIGQKIPAGLEERGPPLGQIPAGVGGKSKK